MFLLTQPKLSHLTHIIVGDIFLVLKLLILLRSLHINAAIVCPKLVALIGLGVIEASLLIV